MGVRPVAPQASVPGWACCVAAGRSAGGSLGPSGARSPGAAFTQVAPRSAPEEAVSFLAAPLAPGVEDAEAGGPRRGKPGFGRDGCSEGPPSAFPGPHHAEAQP